MQRDFNQHEKSGVSRMRLKADRPSRADPPRSPTARPWPAHSPLIVRYVGFGIFPVSSLLMVARSIPVRSMTSARERACDSRAARRAVRPASKSGPNLAGETPGGTPRGLPGDSPGIRESPARPSSANRPRPARGSSRRPRPCEHPTTIVRPTLPAASSARKDSLRAVRPSPHGATGWEWDGSPL